MLSTRGKSGHAHDPHYCQPESLYTFQVAVASWLQRCSFIVWRLTAVSYSVIYP